MKDITSVVDTHLGYRTHSKLYGLEYSGPCPWCGGKNRFHVWPYGGETIPGVGNVGRFQCMDGSQGRAGCGRKGNMIDYIAQRRDCSFEEACEAIDVDPQAVRIYRMDQKVRNLEAEGVSLELACLRVGTDLQIITDYRKNNVVPDIGSRCYTCEKSLAEKSEMWRSHALELARWSSSQLTGGALEYLQHRGLSDATIITHLLGFYPSYKRVKADLWGYEYTDEDRKQKRMRKREIWIPRGIVIPWFDDRRQVICLRFRRLPGDESEEAKQFYGVDERTGEIHRYKAMYGSSTHFLYRGELLSSGCSAALFEGEIDALITAQEVGTACTCVASGSTGWGRSDRFIRRLATCDQVLVCFDADENLAGDKAAQYWLNTLNNAKRWRPLWSDASDMSRDGISLSDWLAIGLEQEPRPIEEMLLVESPLCGVCVDAGIETVAACEDGDGNMYCAAHAPTIEGEQGPPRRYTIDDRAREIRRAEEEQIQERRKHLYARLNGRRVS